MQYKVYNRQSLKYVDGGYVQTFNIDDDYIVNNNSTISVVKKFAPIVKQVDEAITESGTYDIGIGNTIKKILVVSGNATVKSYFGSKYTIEVSGSAELKIIYEIKDTLSDITVGDIIALIQDSGAYHKGVITAVDDTALSISYKSDKELFNDNIPNLYSGDFAQNNELKIAGKFGVEIVIELLRLWFKDTDDTLKKLPVTFVADGDVLDENGEPKMLWTWSNDSINIVDWLTELFEKYNLSLSWDINFDISKNLTIPKLNEDGSDNPDARHPQYLVNLSAITKGGGIVKDNVAMQTITYTVKELPDATVCRVIDSTDKQLCYISSGKNLLNPASSEKYNDTTKKSNYIKADIKNNYYILSFNETDETIRQIIIYNKKKEQLGRYDYTGKTFRFGKDVTLIPTANIADETATNGKRLITIDEVKVNAQYVQVYYYNGATEVQLEKGDTKTAYDAFNKPAIFYLYDKNGEYSISTEKDPVLSDGRERVLPVKTVIATFSQNSTGTDETTPEDVAKDKLIPSQFNQAIEIKINSDSKMFDFVNAKFGDQYQIINEQGSVNSVFTGKKFSNNDKWVTLYFGLGRQNYTDLVQMKMRKQRYSEQYNG